MNKLAIGLIAGFVIGFGFARWFDGGTTNPIDERPIAARVPSEPDNTTTPTFSSRGEAARTLPGQTSTKSASGSARSQSSATSTDAASAALANALERGGDVAKVLDNKVANASGSSNSNNKSSNSPEQAERVPIPVPEPIRSFLQSTDTHNGRTLGQMHSDLENEQDDLAWSYQMELYLQQSFARPSKSGQPLDIRIIECRTTMCEIVGFSTLPNPLDDIGPVMQQMSQQPWWDFDSVNSSAAGDGSGGKFILLLRRKR